MPARFVEITNLAEAARSGDALAYLPSLSVNASDLLNGSGSTLAVALEAASRAESRLARLLVLSASLLVVAHWWLVRSGTQRALSRYGHAHHA